MQGNHTRRSLGRWLAGLFLVRSLPCPAAAPPPRESAAPIPLAETRDPLAREFLRALMEERGVPVYYHGGSTPGALRIIRPECLFRLRPGGRIYVRGYCELRREVRTLRLDRVRPA
jgi:predicted DNA-binding transcriptional regulator YafY